MRVLPPIASMHESAFPAQAVQATWKTSRLERSRLETTAFPTRVGAPAFCRLRASRICAAFFLRRSSSGLATFSCLPRVSELRIVPIA